MVFGPSTCGDPGLLIGAGGLCGASYFIIGGLLVVIGLPQAIAGTALATSRSWGQTASLIAVLVAMLVPGLLIAAGLFSLIAGDGLSITLLIGLVTISPYLWLATRLAGSGGRQTPQGNDG